MSQSEILATVRSLAMSCGLYGRILEALEENPDALAYLEARNFAGPVDLVLFLES